MEDLIMVSKSLPYNKRYSHENPVYGEGEKRAHCEQLFKSGWNQMVGKTRLVP
jgi:hypothetical protein